MLQGGQYLDLSQNVLQGFPLRALALVHVLHGEHALTVLLLHYAHLQQSADNILTPETLAL